MKRIEDSLRDHWDNIKCTVIRVIGAPGEEEYCKQCCGEHWGTRVFFNSGFLGVYAQQ